MSDNDDIIEINEPAATADGMYLGRVQALVRFDVSIPGDVSNNGSTTKSGDGGQKTNINGRKSIPNVAARREPYRTPNITPVFNTMPAPSSSINDCGGTTDDRRRGVQDGERNNNEGVFSFDIFIRSFSSHLFL
ncbi:unnamed protein product [Adineta steineri]|uniref:Uncharacterized protein n=1 Tax=Adineta steineri TaxID=433720 RepID=A0A813UHC6_9BILA|nr:unnamed protein product [Adineta steineri]CAF1019017.1 unnamed protein product [Adineta steineri]